MIINKWFKDLWTSIVTSNDNVFKQEINKLNEELDDLNELLLELEILNTKLKSDLNLKSQLLESLEESIPQKQLEYYWNNKIKPITILAFPARNGYNMNVLDFLKQRNSSVTTISADTNDEKANLCLRWVKNNIRYVGDEKENWQWADETIKRKAGDCEDGAILLANMLLRSGIPYWRIRLNAGNVQHPSASNKTIGHAYVTYLREEDNKWYVLDWCYWYSESVNYQKTWVKAKKYFETWFSWNERYGFVKDSLDRLNDTVS